MALYDQNAAAQVTFVFLEIFEGTDCIRNSDLGVRECCDRLVTHKNQNARYL